MSEKAVNIVLVAWSLPGEGRWLQLKTKIYEAIQNYISIETENDREQKPFEVLGQRVLGSQSETRVVFCRTDMAAVEETIRYALELEAEQIVIIPLIFMLDLSPESYREAWEGLGQLYALESRYADADILFVGSPFRSGKRIETLLRSLSDDEPPALNLLRGVVSRGFKNDWNLFTRFMEKLQSVIPTETRVAIRGSALTGYHYKNERAFDGKGRGTSDLDLVLVGEEVMATWDEEGFYLPGMLTMPLSDEHPQFAPWLNPVREELQHLVERPVNIQAMPYWFLELRRTLMKTPYIFLDH